MPSSDSGPEEDRPSDIDLPCMPPDRPVVERLGEPLPDGVEYCILEANPCILFADWDYAEDWSGRFVRVIRPQALSGARRVDASEFWAAVRRIQVQQ
ncbi:MAG: hypothetical protein ACREUT_17995 [Steroidobacteraceae bacterium]